MKQSAIPSLSQAAQMYAVNRPNQFEGVRQSLYDFQIYPTAGATQFTFFAIPQGQGVSSHTGNAANVKGLWDTNMETAGSLPNPKAFLAESIEIIVEPGSVNTAATHISQVVYSFIAAATALVPVSLGALNDKNTLRQVGELRFFIGSKAYLDEAPLGRFPPKTRFDVESSVATTAAATVVAVGQGNWEGRPYYLNPPVFLAPTQNFNVTLNFPLAVATPSGFNARVGVILDGFLYRQSQ